MPRGCSSTGTLWAGRCSEHRLRSRSSRPAGREGSVELLELRYRERSWPEVLRCVRCRVASRLPHLRCEQSARRSLLPRVRHSVCALTAAPPGIVQRSPAASASAPVAERRLVSILFADLVGFTTLAEGRDAEDTRELLSRYFDLAAEVIGRYGGTVEKFIGDAVMAVWGAPAAHEDDAERAVRAALELVDAVRSLGPAISARAGVLTGEAAVTIGATQPGHGRRRPGQHRQPAAVRRAAGHGPRRRSDPAGRQQGHRVRAGRRADPQGQDGAGARVASPPGRRRASVAAAARTASRRRSSVATTSCGCSRTSSTRRRASAGPGSCRSSARPASARAGSPGSSASTSTAWSRRSAGTTAAARPTARGSASGRSARWSASRAACSRPTTKRRLGRRSLRPSPARARSRGAPLGRALAARPPRDREHGRRPRAALRGLADVLRADCGRRHRRRWCSRTSITPTPGLIDFVDHVIEWSRNEPDLRRHPGPSGAARKAARLGCRQAQFRLPLSRATVRACDARAPRRARAGPARVGGPGDRRAGGRDPAVRRRDGPDAALPRASSRSRTGSIDPSGDLTNLAVPETLTALIASRLDGLDPADRALVPMPRSSARASPSPALAAVSGIAESELEPRLRALVRRELLTLESDPRSPERGQYAFVQALIREVAYNTLAKKDRKARHLAAARFFESLGTDELAGGLAGHYLAAHANAAAGPEADALATQARIALRAAAERAARTGLPAAGPGFLRTGPDGDHRAGRDRRAPRTCRRGRVRGRSLRSRRGPPATSDQRAAGPRRPSRNRERHAGPGPVTDRGLSNARCDRGARARGGGIRRPLERTRAGRPPRPARPSSSPARRQPQVDRARRPSPRGGRTRRLPGRPGRHARDQRHGPRLNRAADRRSRRDSGRQGPRREPRQRQRDPPGDQQPGLPGGAARPAGRA